MRERELDEFSSIFQRSIIPAIEVEKIEIRSIAILDPACRSLAEGLAVRFGARIREASPQDVEQVIAAQPALIIAPAMGEYVDSLLVATAIPTLLVRGSPTADLFRRILVKIPGGRHDLIEQFSFAFALCPPGGTIRLLHVVDAQRLRDLAEALQIAPELDTHADLLGAIRTRMDRLLRGAVRTGRDAAFHVESAIETGDPFEILPVQAREFSLLIVGSQAHHREFLSSRAYELIKRLPDLPVLAL